MSGWGFAYAAAAAAALVPALVSGVIVAILAGRALRTGEVRRGWWIVAGCASVLGAMVAVTALVTSVADTGSIPSWITPLDAIAVIAAALAVGTVVVASVAGTRAAVGRWLGPMAGFGLVTGALIGFFVLPAIGPAGAVIQAVRCDLDPWCQTEAESASAAEVDGTASLWVTGVAEADGVSSGARCERDATEDGYQIAATFEDAVPPVEVLLAVMADGTVRLLTIDAGDYHALPGKSYEPATDVRVADGTTPAAGRMIFTGLGLLGSDLVPVSGASVTGEIAWECPGLAP